MAYLREKSGTPYWQLRYRDLDSGEWREKSTGLRTDSQEETRKAQRNADKTSADEKRIGTPGHSPAFRAWVPQYLASHWQNENSRRRYITAWQAISRFIVERDLIYPRQVRYDHARDYLQWRTATKVHGSKAGHNTALLELKFFSQLINEAKRHGFTETNPFDHLGIGRTAQKVKPDFSDEQIARLKERFGNLAEWMFVASEISLYTGCRFSETQIPATDILLESNSLRLTDSKRDDNDNRKKFLVPLHPKLRPLLARIVESGASQTCEVTRDKNSRINRVIKDTLGKGYSFHCYRVTFVTRCHRAGLSESEAMRLVNHSSKLVHQIYSRLTVDDIRQAQARLDLP